MTKTALIVGGTSGIGLGAARVLLQRNIDTYVIGRRPVEQDLSSLNTIHLLQIDVSTPNAIDSIKKMISGVNFDYVVFSLATEAPLKKFSEITMEEYDYALLLNVKIPFFLTQALLENLNQNARLLYLTSRLSASPEEGSLIYCMTKSAIEIFSLGISKELKGKFLSSTIIPGVVDTEMQKRLREANPRIFPHATLYQEMQSKLQPTKMVGEAIAYHLCDSDDATFLNQRSNVADIIKNMVKSKL